MCWTNVKFLKQPQFSTMKLWNYDIWLCGVLKPVLTVRSRLRNKSHDSMIIAPDLNILNFFLLHLIYFLKIMLPTFFKWLSELFELSRKRARHIQNFGKATLKARHMFRTWSWWRASSCFQVLNAAQTNNWIELVEKERFYDGDMSCATKGACYVLH